MNDKSPIEDRLLAAAEEVIKTTRSLGWQILIDQTKRFIIQARTDLETVDPGDTKRIIELQQEISCYRRLPTLADEIIARGLQTEMLAETEDGGEDDDTGDAGAG